MQITCFIEYQIDPFKLAAFAQYARNWGAIIPRCGGQLLGYFLPHEGSNYRAFGIIGFASLAAYERYRAALKQDPPAQQNFTMAQQQQFILKEERSFLTGVAETIAIASPSSDE